MDHLTSATLKYLRESWWDEEFTEFLVETLRPRAGNRILDVGCGTGIGEISIARLHLSQLRLLGIDLDWQKASVARKETASHNQRAGFAAGDACRLPFTDKAFDSTYCVAVLQHVRDVDAAVREFARVTVGGGRVVAVEPDNGERYFYSSTPSGGRLEELAALLSSTFAAEHGDRTEPSIGPKLPGMFARYGIEPLDVRLFPVSRTQLGRPPDEVWLQRRARAEQVVAQATTEEVRAIGHEYLAVFHAYEAEAFEAGPSFVEIQNTMLFATVAQKTE
jgi:demethylmenaquinone methyltransferase/2-methoxy-6-polyprenyl-1,4-benzoquinol methylase